MESSEKLRLLVEKSDRFLFLEKRFIIRFSGGAFFESSYIPQDDIAFWSLVAASFAVEQRLFFEVSEVDQEPIFQVYGDHRGFCLFRDTYDSEILLFGDTDMDSDPKNLVIFSELSWGLTYFVPESAFVNFEEIIRMGNEVLRVGELSEFTSLKQDFISLGISQEDLPELPIGW